MPTEHQPLRPPDPANARGKAGRPAHLDDGLLHSELVSQRNRGLTYAVAGLALLMTKLAGIFDVAYLWDLAIFGIGTLSVGWFALAAHRAARQDRRANLAAWWIACDMILVTAIVCATGGLASTWFVLYLGCAGAAATHLRRRLAVAFGIGAALLYLGALAAMGQVGLLDRGFFVAASQLLFLFGASFILLSNTRKLLASTQLNLQLKEDADAKVEELTRVTRDLEAMSQLLRDFTESDPLTGLRNRRYLLDRVAEAAGRHGAEGSGRRSEDHNGSAGIIMLDLDHFKVINDTYGHAAGDEALKHLAKVLRRCVRDRDVLVRWGGDEFIILLPKVDKERIREVVERILTAVRARPCRLAPNGSQDLTCRITCSIGWSAFDWQAAHDGVAPWESAMAAADQALYAAKRHGRDRDWYLPVSEVAPAGPVEPAVPEMAAVHAGNELEPRYVAA